ncbi:MAG: serine/threonine-protein kinase [Dissulfurispiraceae bacterium]
MKHIKLRNVVWEYDPSILLGPPGGFGTVFLGHSEKGEEVAVKKLNISAASIGHRELAIAEELAGRNLSHVIPFYDSGIDADTSEYFVIMAKAQRSLQQVIESGAISEADAIKVLTDIALGLHEVGGIVHRDLKPGNVLYHQDKWKLADFGIARFVEDSTSINTLKECLSPLYASPEQWRLERATKATDVYAFGCIAFALLSGQPPFTSGDLRKRHLHEDPQRLSASSGMQQLVSLCLRKSQNARPSIDSIIRQLASLNSATVSHSGIAAAGAALAVEAAKKESERSLKHTEEEARTELARDAIKSLDSILKTMFEAIEHDAQMARRISQRGIELGSGRLQVEIPFPLLSKDAFSESRKNIICGALISIEQQNSRYYRGRSANLWFVELSSGEFRWYEIPYMTWGISSDNDFFPYGISQESEIQDADYAAAPITHSVYEAATPRPIDREHADEFIARWVTRLAEASRNRLQPPRSLPEQ